MVGSEDLDEILGALDEAMDEFEKCKKDKKNTYFKNAYADLNEVLDGVTDILNDKGIRIFPSTSVRETVSGGFQNVFETMLMHVESQQFIKAELILPDDEPQKVGGAITYFRRYTLKTLLNLLDEDDDGETASGRGKGFGSKKKSKKSKDEDDEDDDEDDKPKSKKKRGLGKKSKKKDDDEDDEDEESDDDSKSFKRKSRKSKKKSKDEDDDEDDDEDEKPKKKGRGKKTKSKKSKSKDDDEDDEKPKKKKSSRRTTKKSK